MIEHPEQTTATVHAQEPRPTLPDGPATPPVEAGLTVAGAAAEEGPGTPDSTAAVTGGEPLSPDRSNGAAASRHAEAGRKGARRVHELIKRGRLYEQEHGLKSGRQRLRQLIELGKLYEQEHGLAVGGRRARAGRPRRVRSEQVLVNLLQSVYRLAKPRFRPQIARLIDALQAETN